jgi:hypothetical protein
VQIDVELSGRKSLGGGRTGREGLPVDGNGLTHLGRFRFEQLVPDHHHDDGGTAARQRVPADPDRQALRAGRQDSGAHRKRAGAELEGLAASGGGSGIGSFHRLRQSLKRVCSFSFVARSH